MGVVVVVVGVVVVVVGVVVVVVGRVVVVVPVTQEPPEHWPEVHRFVQESSVS